MQGKGRGRGAPPTATERNLEVTSPELKECCLAGVQAWGCRKAVTFSWSVSVQEIGLVEAVEAGGSSDLLRLAAVIEGSAS